MGQTFSEPVSMDPTLGYVGIALRSPNKIRLLHAPREVVEVTERVIGEIQSKAGEAEFVTSKDKYGTLGYNVGSEWCFQVNSGKTAATSGKLFTIRMLEEMHKLGYDPVVSSDLTRTYDQATWIFEKTTHERPTAKVVCLAPGKSDTLVMVRANERFQDVVKASINEAWPLGIQKEQSIESCGETLAEIKLNGNPWIDYAGAENINCRQMLIQIFGQLGSINYKLLFGTNIKGGTDSYFFIYDENYRIDPSNICMVSLNKYDRLRLINCVDLAGPIRDTILVNGGEIQREEDKYGSWEFKLKGTPWCTHGEEAIQSRRLISRVSEKLLEHGWALTNAIDITRSLNDKSVLLYTRAPNYSARFACVALSDINRIRLLDFSTSHTQELKSMIERFYLPGVEKEKQRDDFCYEMDLNGPPWTYNSSFNLHARSALMNVLKKANSLGWRLVASADVSAKYVRQDNGPDYPIDVHSWYFVYWPRDTGSVLEKSNDLYPDLNQPPSYQESFAY